MSKMDDLIYKLCQDEFLEYKIADVTTYEQPTKYIVKNTNYDDSYSTPVLTAGQTFILGYTNEEDGIYDASKENPVIIFDDFTGAIKWVDFPFKVKSSAMKIIKANDKILIRYLYYLMKYIGFSSIEHKRLWIRVYSEFIIPVPPLEIQQEIVRILDAFTLLTEELSKELSDRKLQYEYYKNKLLAFNKADVSFYALGDVCNVVSGGTPSKNNTEYWNNGTVRWLGSTVCKNQKTVDEITDYISEKGLLESSAKIMCKNTTLIALVGATIGKVAYLPFEAAINQNIAGVYPKDTTILNPAYVYYACTMFYPRFVALTQGSKLAMANMSFVRSLEIAIPSMDIQNKVVYVLDNFESICKDLNIGLPAEIEARQKQYEYYRDLLFTYVATGKRPGHPIEDT